METRENIRGRGANHNLKNRFETLEYSTEDVDREEVEEEKKPKTLFLKDSSKTILTHNRSPDIPFEFSINPYRGCEHGCIYCYARPTHEYLGFSSGLDFETRILVKENAPELLRNELSSEKWTPQTISISGVTDCYQPIERKLELTRRCLQVLSEFRNPVTLITKNQLITRDLDLFEELNRYRCVGIFISVTTLDAELASKMEPRTSMPSARLEAIRKLSDAGIPVGVMLAPMILGLTDYEMPNILKEAKKAGARFAGYVPLRLPYSVSELFLDWIDRHFPEKKSKIVQRLHSVRGGKLNDSHFHSRMQGEGIFADQLQKTFDLFVRKLGFNEGSLNLSREHFRRPGAQLKLF